MSKDNGIQICIKEAIKFGESLNSAYCFSEIFPYIVIDVLLYLLSIESWDIRMVNKLQSIAFVFN